MVADAAHPGPQHGGIDTAEQRVVDDSRRPLRESTLVAIDQQLMKLYAKLEEAGIPAGSPVTRRLFSQ